MKYRAFFNCETDKVELQRRDLNQGIWVKFAQFEDEAAALKRLDEVAAKPSKVIKEVEVIDDKEMMRSI